PARGEGSFVSRLRDFHINNEKDETDETDEAAEIAATDARSQSGEALQRASTAACSAPTQTSGGEST
ncbi:MAG: hypothetical protein ABTR92_09165, partial [Candidatus Accumulibacter phosphatis]